MRIGAELGQCIRSANSQCKKILKIPFGEIVTPSGYVIGGEGKGEDGRRCRGWGKEGECRVEKI